MIHILILHNNRKKKKINTGELYIIGIYFKHETTHIHATKKESKK